MNASASILLPLRDAAWLTRRRATAYSEIMAVVFLGAAAAWVVLSTNGLDPTGKPLGTDFLSFWAASKLALSGHPEAVYSVAAHYTAEQAAFPGVEIGYAAFFYPPVFLLICLPLATLPYLPSLLIWVAVTGCAYWAVLTRFLKNWRAHWIAFLSFPAVIINIGHGQNGFLTAALFGGGVLATEKRPILAGILFGCLVFKPHLAVLVPIALAARGAWRAFAAAAATSIALVLLSLAVFGWKTWEGFFAISPLAGQALTENWVGAEKMQSVFSAVRLLNGSVFTAYAAQAVVALIAAAALVVLARVQTRPLANGAALAAATLLATPFLLDYDLTLLAIPIAWLYSEARWSGFRPWEKTVLFAAFVLPLVSRLIALYLGLPVGPLVIALLFGLILRRAFAERISQASRVNSRAEGPATAAGAA